MIGYNVNNICVGQCQHIHDDNSNNNNNNNNNNNDNILSSHLFHASSVSVLEGHNVDGQ